MSVWKNGSTYCYGGDFSVGLYFRKGVKMLHKAHAINKPGEVLVGSILTCYSTSVSLLLNEKKKQYK